MHWEISLLIFGIKQVIKSAQKGNFVSSAHVDVASMYLQWFLFLAMK
jgi:hypothetical protein